ncbi:unnamed protein product [Paramecium sonneborni]|uniref:Transmembrane protein n=1 Tax=Paramecium sonneborni TaxID=65129 RepID=A0A8S1MV34_9CILI|nr:unnamed protein product [Paramecium sonneborni]
MLNCFIFLQLIDLILIAFYHNQKLVYYAIKNQQENKNVLGDFKSSQVTIKEYLKYFSGIQIKQILSWSTDLSIGLFESQQGVMNVERIKLQKQGTIYLPNIDYYCCEPLPQEWMNQFEKRKKINNNTSFAISDVSNILDHSRVQQTKQPSRKVVILQPLPKINQINLRFYILNFWNIKKTQIKYLILIIDLHLVNYFYVFLLYILTNIQCNFQINLSKQGLTRKKQIQKNSVKKYNQYQSNFVDKSCQFLSHLKAKIKVYSLQILIYGFQIRIQQFMLL